MSEGDWMTWEEAADLVGCPVPTIDWHKRQGRIVSRGRHARSLERASVEEFKIWWQERQRAVHPRTRRETGIGWQPPEPTGWITTADAGAMLGVGANEIAHLVHQGHLHGVKVSHRFWVRESDVEAYRTEEARWISLVAASELTGISAVTLQRYGKLGEIERRQNAGQRPSVSRASVVAFADAYLRERAERQAERSKPTGPPDDTHVWLTTAVVALMLSVSAGRVRQLAGDDRIPSVKVGGRLWFRRDLIEQYVAARVVQRRHDSTHV